jgi:nitrate/nitrite-specific signal transduction histidine kinase
MRQRVQRVAGTLAIESEPGTGTAVSASVPAIPRAAGLGHQDQEASVE